MSGVRRPTRRPLKIYAFDPMHGRAALGRITIDVENEKLAPGPRGARLAIIDYDPTTKTTYPPVDLDHPHVLMQGGLDPAPSDRWFRQQMVYAVAMRVLENFDRALGRRIRFRRKQLRIFPHALREANAFYDFQNGALLFGYFDADDVDPGANVPGKTVYTCLSQDIVAHEMTHAIVDQLRFFFREPSNHDVPAFHEGFADIVAIFQHFTFPDVLRDAIARERGDLRSSRPLVELAAQFGYARGDGAALREAVDTPSPRAYREILEPHGRGAILVAAVFDAFFATYQRRSEDLLRIATGGTGKLPDGHLHPDLVGRLATEAATTAQQVLAMCIRAFDYLPPVDVTFGDFLRALITADHELSPIDEAGLRAALIEAFRVRGIYAEGVGSLSEGDLILDATTLPRVPVAPLYALLEDNVRKASTSAESLENADPQGADETTLANAKPDVPKEYAIALHAYARENAAILRLSPDHRIRIVGFHTSFRVDQRGALNVELVVQIIQSERRLTPEGDVRAYDAESEAQEQRARDQGGAPFRAGVTLVVDQHGEVRYAASKPFDDRRRQAHAAFIASCDAVDARLAEEGPTSAYAETRITRRMIAACHASGG